MLMQTTILGSGTRVPEFLEGCLPERACEGFMRFGSLVSGFGVNGSRVSGFRAGALAERLEASRLLWLL